MSKSCSFDHEWILAIGRDVITKERSDAIFFLPSLKAHRLLRT